MYCALCAIKRVRENKRVAMLIYIDSATVLLGLVTDSRRVSLCRSLPLDIITLNTLSCSPTCRKCTSIVCRDIRKQQSVRNRRIIRVFYTDNYSN